ncbi:MAG: hypothetical protein MK080_10530 [Opitutales bacterium]|nr:hypothetical protein [Opitutales bacterium]
MKTRTLLLLVSAPFASMIAEPDMSKMIDPELAQEIARFTGEVGGKIQMAAKTLDDDGDGKLEYRSTLRTLMGRGFARVNMEAPVSEELLENGTTAEAIHKNNAEADKQISAFMKPNADGLIGEAEFTKMFSTAIYQLGIARSLSLDVDKDQKLSLKEYATGFPIRKGEETDDEGFTENQRRGFASQDKNESGYLEGTEWMPAEFYHAVEEVSDVLIMVFGAGILDEDGDGSISKPELAKHLPESENLPESFPMTSAINYFRALSHDDQHALAEAMLVSLSDS